MSEGIAGAEPLDEEADDELTLLLEEALDRHDAGQQDMHDLLERAGPRAEELREQLRVFLDLDTLSDELSDEPREQPALEALGRFRDLRPLGVGGHGQVYAAHDPQLGREVALKVLSGRGLVDDANAWIHSESRALASLEHPAVVRVYETPEENGVAYVVMELVHGPSLAEVLPLLGRVRSDAGSSTTPDAPPAVARVAEELRPMAARLRLVSRLARALHACHERGVVHRDVKPANVLISSEGPKLIDFGLSHLEDEESSLGLTQRLVGTAGYVAPEQVESDEVGKDPRADQFALGVVLYELITGVHPFLHKSRHRTMDAISAARPTHPRKVAPEIAPDVALICLHALERDPADRYPDMDALAADLDAVLDYRAIGLRAPSTWTQLRLWLWRHKRQVLLTGGPVVAICLALFGLWLHLARAERRDLRAHLDELFLNSLPEQGELPTAADFEGHFGRLISARERCLVLDSHLLAPLLLEKLEPRYRELASVSEARFMRRLERDRMSAGINILDVKQVFEEWAFASRMNDLVQGRLESGHARFDESLGLPAEGRLHRFNHKANPLAHMIESKRGDILKEGRYRFRGEQDGQPIELEFSVYWLGAHVLPPRPLDATLARAMVECKGRPDEPHPSSSDPQDQPLVWGHNMVTMNVRVVPFRILPKPVTRGQLEDALGDGLAELLPPGYVASELGRDEPVVVPILVARAYASAVGARLPTVAELLAARRAGLIDFGTQLYELTSVTDFDFRNALAARVEVFDDPDFPQNAAQLANWAHFIPESSVKSNATFRVAHTVGSGIPGFRQKHPK